MPRDSNTTAPHAGETNSTAIPKDGNIPGHAKPPRSGGSDDAVTPPSKPRESTDDFGAEVSPEERARRERELTETGGGY